MWCGFLVFYGLFSFRYSSRRVGFPFVLCGVVVVFFYVRIVGLVGFSVVGLVCCCVLFFVLFWCLWLVVCCVCRFWVVRWFFFWCFVVWGDFFFRFVLVAYLCFFFWVECLVIVG